MTCQASTFMHMHMYLNVYKKKGESNSLTVVSFATASFKGEFSELNWNKPAGYETCFRRGKEGHAHTPHLRTFYGTEKHQF